MPIHILPQSRRHFLRNAALLASAPLFDQIGYSATSADNSERWALLSDIHIHADQSFVSKQGTNMAENLKKVIADVLSEKDTLAGVIINGDCAYNSGLPEDYASVAELLQPLRDAGLPIHITLGNHDDRDVLATGLGKLDGEGVVPGKRCAVVETPLVRWILLDSLLHIPKVEGELGPEQLAWLEKQLADPSGKPAIVMMHHTPVLPPEPVPGEEKPPRFGGLLDTQALWDILNKSTAAKAHFWGHSHYWGVEVGKEGDYHRVNLPTTAYIFKPDAPQGWVRASLNPKGMAIELRCIDSTNPKHGETHQFVWR